MIVLTNHARTAILNKISSDYVERFRRRVIFSEISDPTFWTYLRGDTFEDLRLSDYEICVAFWLFILIEKQVDDGKNSENRVLKGFVRRRIGQWYEKPTKSRN